jgi:hypothetical protein
MCCPNNICQCLKPFFLRHGYCGKLSKSVCPSQYFRFCFCKNVLSTNTTCQCYKKNFRHRCCGKLSKSVQMFQAFLVKMCCLKTYANVIKLFSLALMLRQIKQECSNVLGFSCKNVLSKQHLSML